MNKMLTFKVREQDRRDWGNVAVITAGEWFCIPALMMGGMMDEGLPLAGIAFCTVTGGLILLFCACFMGKRSFVSGLPSIVICAEGLGIRGAWFGVQAAIYGASFSAMAANVLGISFRPGALRSFGASSWAFSPCTGTRPLGVFTTS